MKKTGIRIFAKLKAIMAKHKLFILATAVVLSGLFLSGCHNNTAVDDIMTLSSDSSNAGAVPEININDSDVSLSVNQ